jgi:hypothetical protein
MKGASQLIELGIKKVFDMRSLPEMQRYHSEGVPHIEGVEFVPTPVFRDEDYSPEEMAKCVVRILGKLQWFGSS